MPDEIPVRLRSVQRPVAHPWKGGLRIGRLVRSGSVIACAPPAHHHQHLPGQGRCPGDRSDVDSLCSSRPVGRSWDPALRVGPRAAPGQSRPFEAPAAHPVGMTGRCPACFASATSTPTIAFVIGISRRSRPSLACGCGCDHPAAEPLPAGCCPGCRREEATRPVAVPPPGGPHRGTEADGSEQDGDCSWVHACCWARTVAGSGLIAMVAEGAVRGQVQAYRTMRARRTNSSTMPRP